MVKVISEETAKELKFHYAFKSVDEFYELAKSIYCPIIGRYTFGLKLTEMSEIKQMIENKARYNHFDIYIILKDPIMKKFYLAMPNYKEKEETPWDYFMAGISSRNLLIEKKARRILYSSIEHSYEDIDDILNLLSDKFGEFVYITMNDISKHIPIKDIVYPRTVVIEYINMGRYRKSKLEKCLKSISPDILLPSMVKQVKKLHKEKDQYLKNGLGNSVIKDLNTRNLNLLYYTLVINKPYYLNDPVVLLEIYERGIKAK